MDVSLVTVAEPASAAVVVAAPMAAAAASVQEVGAVEGGRYRGRRLL